MNNLPIIPTRNLVVQTVGKELLVYDLTKHRVFNLNETSALVFNACDGQTSFEALKHRYELTDDLIHFALRELKTNGLLEDYRSDYFAGLSRREVVRRIGVTCAAALPLIVGITAPTAANAQSITCTPDAGDGGNGAACHCSRAIDLFLCNTTRGADCKAGCLCRVTDRQTQCNNNGNCIGVCG